MGEIIRRRNAAVSAGFWLEAVALGYAQLEIALRQLLELSNVGKGPVDPKEVEKCERLIQLIELAEKYEMIPSDCAEELRTFNARRNQGIHHLARGDIRYEELKNEADAIAELHFKIQSIWLKITIGPQESISG